MEATAVGAAWTLIIPEGATPAQVMLLLMGGLGLYWLYKIKGYVKTIYEESRPRLVDGTLVYDWKNKHSTEKAIIELAQSISLMEAHIGELIRRRRREEEDLNGLS
jgi:hypothetical protein